MPNLALFISSLMLMCLLIPLISQWNKFKLDVFDYFTGFILLYFGAWGILNSFMLKLSNLNSISIFFAFFIVLVPTLLTWKLLRYLSTSKYGSLTKNLYITEIGQIIAKVKLPQLLLLVLGLLAFLCYSIGKYNISATYTQATLKTLNITLPVWYKIIFALFRPLLMVASVGIAFKLFQAKKVGQIVVLVCLACLVLMMECIFGRAAFLIFWFTFLAVYVSTKKISFLNWKNLLFITFIFTSTFLYSNAYQKVRALFVLRYARASIYQMYQTPDSSPISSFRSFMNRFQEQATSDHYGHLIFSSKKTIHNFKVRPSEWHFNYLFINQQLFHGYYRHVPYGAILLAAIKFAVPREIWKNKPVNLLQPMAFSIYGLVYKVFHAPNLFGFIQADFGFLSLVISSLFLLFAILFISKSLAITKQHPFLYLTIAGQAFYFFSEIEINYDGYFYFFRGVILISLIYLFFYFSKTILSTIICHITKSFSEKIV